jgi:hypothetical protein
MMPMSMRIGDMICSPLRRTMLMVRATQQAYMIYCLPSIVIEHYDACVHSLCSTAIRSCSSLSLAADRTD